MRLPVFLFAASLAAAQTGQSFRLAYRKQSAEQIAQAIRAAGEAARVTADPVKAVVTVDGTAAQLAMAG